MFEIFFKNGLQIDFACTILLLHVVYYDTKTLWTPLEWFMNDVLAQRLYLETRSLPGRVHIAVVFIGVHANWNRGISICVWCGRPSTFSFSYSTRSNTETLFKTSKIFIERLTTTYTTRIIYMYIYIYMYRIRALGVWYIHVGFDWRNTFRVEREKQKQQSRGQTLERSLSTVRALRTSNPYRTRTRTFAQTSILNVKICLYINSSAFCSFFLCPCQWFTLSSHLSTNTPRVCLTVKRYVFRINVYIFFPTFFS